MNPKLRKFKYLPKAVLKFMEELLERNEALEKQVQALKVKLAEE